MADQQNSKDVKLLKSTKITVFVDEALPDILVVTYEFGVKIFKGVLLDSTKRNIPCGVANINPAFNVPTKDPDEDTLYAVNQRFAYTDPTTSKKKNVQMPSKYKNNKMTVRLRPRQVLCSKCKGICNENSENVSKKAKSADSAVQELPVKKSENAPVTRSSYTSITNKRKMRNQEPTLVPKLTRLTLQECKDFNLDNSLLNKKPLASNNSENKDNVNDHSTSSYESSNSEDNTELQDNTRLTRKKIIPKKRISVDEIWSEVPSEPSEEDTNHLNIQDNDETNCVSTNTRTIKISYGPQGEGTVLKIPAKIDNLNSEENVNIEEKKNVDTPINKAARKALKKAKKHARRKVLISGGSPMYIGNNSPRYTIGTSPRYTVGSASPRHGLGNNSPRYICPFEINAPRRRKHKMKHKKKHKEDKKQKDSVVGPFITLNISED